MATFASAQLEMELQIGDYSFDVQRYMATFALNTIPSATLTVGTGRDVRSGRAATIHRASSQLEKNRAARVYLTVRKGVELGAELGLPDGRFLIFEGKLSGRGWSRGNKTAQVVLRLQHWLGDLNKGSSVAASSHPSNPANFTYPAVARLMGNPTLAAETGTATANDPSWVPMIDPGLVTQAALSDLWGEVLHKFMQQVAADDPFERLLLSRGATSGASGDPKVLAALARIGPNPAGAPLNLDLSGADAVTISEGIRRALSQEIGNPWANVTLWGKLVGEWSPAYWFAVVPRVEDALIVPFTGALRQQTWKTLEVDDNVMADLTGEISQPLRAVGIIWPAMSAAGTFLGAGPVRLDFGGAAGWYQPEGLDDGMVLLKQPPLWLQDPSISYMHVTGAEGIDGGAIATQLDAEDAGQPITPARDLAAMPGRQQTLLDAYAHQWYVLESLKTRSGEVAGKLRFDIAPGSTVRLEIGGSRNIAAALDDLRDTHYGTVLQVSYVIDAGQRECGTIFTLSHVQSSEENESDTASVVKPPLYQQAWPGAVLTKAGTP